MVPTLRNLARIAMVFSKDLNYFFEPEPQTLFRVHRGKDRVRLPQSNTEDPSYYFESLGYMVPDRQLDPYFAEFLPRKVGREPRAHQHVGCEFLYLLTGALDVRHGDAVHHVEAGDAVYFDASTIHSYQCASHEPATALIVTLQQAAAGPQPYAGRGPGMQQGRPRAAATVPVTIPAARGRSFDQGAAGSDEQRDRTQDESWAASPVRTAQDDEKWRPSRPPFFRYTEGTGGQATRGVRGTSYGELHAPGRTMCRNSLTQGGTLCPNIWARLLVIRSPAFLSLHRLENITSHPPTTQRMGWCMRTRCRRSWSRRRRCTNSGEMSNRHRCGKSTSSPVTVKSDVISHWVLGDPEDVKGKRIEYDSAITEDVPGQRIAWNSVTEGIDESGVVTFAPHPSGRGTVVSLRERVKVPGGALANAVAAVVERSPRQTVIEDLRHFKEMAEAGEIPSVKGQPHGPRGATGKMREWMYGESNPTPPGTSDAA